MTVEDALAPSAAVRIGGRHPLPMRSEPTLTRRIAVTTGALLASRAVALAAGIVTLGLAARYLGLEQFGALTAAMAYSSMFAVLADLGLSTVAAREISRQPESEPAVLGTVLALGMGAAVALVGAGLVAMRVFYGDASHAGVREASVILLAQVIAVPVTGTARARLTAFQRGHRIAFGDLGLSIGIGVATVVAVAAGLGYRGVVVAITGGYFVQAAVMAGAALRDVPRLTFKPRLALRLCTVGLPFAGVLVLNYLYFRLDVFLLSWLKPAADVARYGLAYRVFDGLMVLPSYLMLAIFPMLAGGQVARDVLARIVGAALGVLEAIALPVGALIAIFAPQIVVLLGGREYAAAAPALAILAAALSLSYLAGVYGNALMAIGSGRKLLALTAGPLAVNLVTNLVLIPPLGIVGAAISVVVSELVALVLIRAYYVRLVGRPEPPRHTRIAVAGVSLACLALVKFLLLRDSDPLLLVCVGGSVGVFLYLGLLLRLGAIAPEIIERMPFAARFARTGR
jgi:O-antigen/teichoic acid export membrane protein